MKKILQTRWLFD